MGCMDVFLSITVLSFLAGVGGTGIGGAIGSCFHRSSDRMISYLLSAAAGMMIAIVCLELLVESVGSAQSEMGNVGVFFAIASLGVGVGVVAALNHVIDVKTRDEVKHTAAKSHPATHDAIDELRHVDHYNQHVAKRDPKRDLWVAGVVIGCAIALHNVPEGMSIGASYALDLTTAGNAALVLAVLIFIHNVPEGMAVAVPLIAGGMSQLKAVALTALSGLPMMLGAWLGLWMGDASQLGLSCALGFASGAMLYVSFGEILPQAFLMNRSKVPAFFVLIGIAIGMLLVYL